MGQRRLEIVAPINVFVPARKTLLEQLVDIWGIKASRPHMNVVEDCRCTTSPHTYLLLEAVFLGLSARNTFYYVYKPVALISESRQQKCIHNYHVKIRSIFIHLYGVQNVPSKLFSKSDCNLHSRLPLQLSMTGPKHTRPISTLISVSRCNCFRRPFALKDSSARVYRRFYYGHISDHKMAPQLEPFFKQ